MFVGEIIDALRKHELVNTDFGDQLDKVISYGTSDKFLYKDRLAFQTHLNSVLRNLYTRFPLKNTHLYLRCIPGVSVYALTKENSESVTPNAYILDTTYITEVGEFVEDVLTITGVTKVATNTPIQLNDYSSSMTIKTRNSNTIWIPNSLTKDSTLLKIDYRALPAEWGGLRDEDI